MAKRFTNTNKYKGPFFRSLKGPYKLLWDFLYHECDHCGIWIVDFTIASIYLGDDMPVNKSDALKFFNSDKVRIVEFDNGKRWFIPGFIEEQYKGKLNPKNKAHASVIEVLEHYNLLGDKFEIKGLARGLQGAKDMDMDMDIMEEGVEETKSPEIGLLPDMLSEFKTVFPKYPTDKEKDYSASLQIAYKIGSENNWTKDTVTSIRRPDILKRWGEILQFVKSDKWFSTRSISDLNNEWQRLIQGFYHYKPEIKTKPSHELSAREKRDQAILNG